MVDQIKESFDQIEALESVFKQSKNQLQANDKHMVYEVIFCNLREDQYHKLHGDDAIKCFPVNQERTSLMIKLHNLKASILNSSWSLVGSRRKQSEKVEACLKAVDPRSQLTNALASIPPTQFVKLSDPTIIDGTNVSFEDNSSVISSAPKDTFKGKRVSQIVNAQNELQWHEAWPEALMQYPTVAHYCAQEQNDCANKLFVIKELPHLETILAPSTVNADRGANPAAPDTPPRPRPRPPPPPQDESGFPTWAIILIIAFAILMVGGFALFFYIRKRTRSDLYY
jgi:hypothetical protein